MASIIRASSFALIAASGLVLAGCASESGGGIGSMFGPTTTASIPEKPKVDPVCVTLTSQIEGLNKEGITEKIEKAAARKYKMTRTDLNKVAQLNRANSEFQLKCAVTSTTAQLSPATDATAKVAPVQTAKATSETPAGGN